MSAVLGVAFGIIAASALSMAGVGVYDYLPRAFASWVTAWSVAGGVVGALVGFVAELEYLRMPPRKREARISDPRELLVGAAACGAIVGAIVGALLGWLGEPYASNLAPRIANFTAFAAKTSLLIAWVAVASVVTIPLGGYLGLLAGLRKFIEIKDESEVNSS